MEEHIIKSLSDYLQVVEELKEEYPARLFGNNLTVCTLLFRGHSDISYRLEPGIHRKTITRLGEKQEITNSRYTAFSTEKRILRHFMSEASAFVPVGSIDYNDYSKWVSLAQHYGVPTRFLDWTSNPLVALYFACEGNDSKDAVVWMCHLNNYERFARFAEQNENRGTGNATIAELIKRCVEGSCENTDLPKYPFFYKPYYFDTRMSAQSSHFMIWGEDERAFEEMIPEERYMQFTPPPDGVRIYSVDDRKCCLYKVTIKASSKQELMRQMDTVGINAKTLFPGLDGIGRYIERHYRFNYDETIL